MLWAEYAPAVPPAAREVMPEDRPRVWCASP